MAIRGGSKKFQYILNDGAMKIMEIDGDEFADCDYGIMVDSSPETQQLTEKLDTLATSSSSKSNSLILLNYENIYFSFFVRDSKNYRKR